jgi:hypothetical protein
MTTEPKPFDDPADEREWLAQERACQSETAADDALAARYRDLARGLRALPSAELPADFARRVAAAARRDDGVLGIFERAMLAVLCVVFVIVLYALATIGQSLPDAPSMTGWQWLCALLICAAVAALPAASGAATIRRTTPRMR